MYSTNRGTVGGFFLAGRSMVWWPVSAECVRHRVCICLPCPAMPWALWHCEPLVALWGGCKSNSFSSQWCLRAGCTNKATGWAGRSAGGSCLSCLDCVTNLFEYKWIGNVSTDKSSALPFMPLLNFPTFGLCSFHCTQRSWLTLRLSQTGINLLKFSPLLLYCFYFW